MSGAHRPSCCVAVKLWHTNMEHSVASLEAKANVCCVKFNPNSRYHLAFGSAGKQTSAQIPGSLGAMVHPLRALPNILF